MLSKTAIKYIQSLTFKKFRDENGQFIAEGPKVVGEIIATGTCSCKTVYAVSEYIQAKKDFLQNIGIEFVEITDIELQKISSLKTPNQVVAVFHKRKFQEPSIDNNITLLLDNIMDPGNMGTIIRIADWFGVSDIICNEQCVDIYNSKVIQSSMASIARININYINLKDYLTRHNEVHSYAATLQGNNVYSLKKKLPCFIVIGNESAGIDKDILKLVSEEISIPRIGSAESLNAAVATGILLSSFSR